MENSRLAKRIKSRLGEQGTMANGKGIRVKLWREGKNVLVRSDALHITTYGNSVEGALKNFKEAMALSLEAMTAKSIAKKQALPFEFELKPGFDFYGRTVAKGKAAGAY